MKAARDLKEAHPVAARAVIAGGNRDAVGLRVAGLKMETHPLVKRDRAAVHRGRDRADQDAEPPLIPAAGITMGERGTPSPGGAVIGYGRTPGPETGV